MARQKKQSQNLNENAERIYEQGIIIKSDLFKLQVAECNLDKSWSKVPQLEPVEHVHFYHTFDSDGNRMTKTNAVAGHFHVIEYQDQGPDNPVKITFVSGPMRQVKRYIDGMPKILNEPVESKLHDEHTHDIAYLRTSHVKTRTISPIAANIEADEANRLSPVAGVQIG